MSFIRKLEKNEVRFIVTTDEDDHAPDQDFDPECLKVIKKRMKEGSIWAWCTIVVRAHWNAQRNLCTGTATLGGCSYESEEDFRANSGYFEQMCDEALADLQENMEDHARLLEPLITQASYEEWLVEKTHEE